MRVVGILAFGLVFAAVAALLLGACHGVVAAAEECTSAYNYLAGCLTFVSGLDTIPNPTCCGGINNLNTEDPHCLCTIIREFDKNPNVNFTKACALPLQCSVAVDVVQCPTLRLPPGYALPPAPPSEYYASVLGDESAASSLLRPPYGATWCVVTLLLAAFCTSLLGCVS